MSASWQQMSSRSRYQRRDRRAGQLFALVAVVAVPILVTSLPGYWVQLCTTGAIDAVLLQSIGVLADRSKLFVLCPLAFASIGGWVVLQLFQWGWPGGFYFWLFLGGLAGVPFGLLMGIPALRLRGLYLAVVTLSFAFALDSIYQVTPFPGATDPEKLFTLPSLVSSGGSYFVFCWIIFVVLALALYALDRLPMGAAWRCVARSERATAAMGLSVRNAKLGVFVISAFIAALSGGMLVGQVSTVVEANFSPESALVLFAVALLVGSGLAEGAAVGGLISAFAPQVLTSIHVPQTVGNILFPLGTIQVLSTGVSASAAWRASFRRVLRRRRIRSVAPTSVEVAPRDAVPSAGRAAPLSGTAPSAPPMTPPTGSLRPRQVSRGGEVALAVTDLTVRFAGVLALDKVNLEVPYGGVVGLVGPNGAGKSTFVDAVTGFIRDYEGCVMVDGRRVDRLVVHKRVRAGVRRTFQQERTIPELTAGDYVRVAARRALSSGDLTQILSFIGGPSPYERIADIDVGTRRLVEVAGCLGAQPKVLLLDEPTAGLAEAESLDFARRVTEMPEVFGCAVLLIEHDMDVVRAACAHVTIMDFGHKIAEGRPEEVLALEAVVTAYLGDPSDKAPVEA